MLTDTLVQFSNNQSAQEVTAIAQAIMMLVTAILTYISHRKAKS